MRAFDTAFEACLPWLTLAVLASGLTYSCAAHAGDVPKPPPSTTRVFDGRMYECYDTEAYRAIVIVYRVWMPEAANRLALTEALLRARGNEAEALHIQVGLLSQKVGVLELHRNLLMAEQASWEKRDRGLRLSRNVQEALHWLAHGVAIVTIGVLSASHVRD